MAYLGLHIKTLDDYPVIPGVEHDNIPLGRGQMDLRGERVSVGPLDVYRADYRCRMWFRELQTGDALHVGLVQPRGAPVRFGSEMLETATLVCWHLSHSTEYDYLAEPGALFHIVDVPAEIVRARGWALPPPDPFPVHLDKARSTAALLERWIACVRSGGNIDKPQSVQSILQSIDDLTANALYRHTGVQARHPAQVNQRRLLGEATSYLMEHGSNGPVTVFELCSVLRCSSRALFAAFESQIGIGPKQLHNRLRLYSLRSKLRSTSPDKSTVSQLIHEAGFSHLGRTAGLYRAHFGETPVETLRRGS